MHINKLIQERNKMIQIVNLGNCIHIFDDEEKRFIKLTTTNLKRDCLAAKISKQKGDPEKP